MMKKLLLFLSLSAFLFAGCGKSSSDDDVKGSLTVQSDNLFYCETSVGVEKCFNVTVDGPDVKPEMILWYVDGNMECVGNNFTYITKAGNHKIGYRIPAKYSATGSELANEVSVNVYNSDGVYILNEPGFGSGEDMRGVNRYKFGGSTVERFIKGDFNTFASTDQYIANWSGVIYVVASYVDDGVSFSSFDAGSGKFIKAEKDVNGLAVKGDYSTDSGLRAFAGISPEKGVLTTRKGAYVVELNGGQFKVGSTVVNGTEAGAYNVFVTDGYVFIISGGKALAYKADGFSVTSKPVELGAARVGFVQSKDGAVWAADEADMLRIDPLTLKVETLQMGASITYSDMPWRTAPWVASTTENVMYFAKDEYGSGKEVYKYDITAKTLKSQFLTQANFDGQMLYSTSLYYDSQRGELLCSTVKGYGPDGKYNGLFSFKDDGTRVGSLVYDTNTGYGTSDMWFPAMMCPVKSFVAPVQ
ncbi:MAG: DUF5074 domain-containing protein [Rikenellaceae bacterium]|nr:DUF5074 domain-containing protein [Rikenellaceae bacterium]